MQHFSVLFNSVAIHYKLKKQAQQWQGTQHCTYFHSPIEIICQHTQTPAVKEQTCCPPGTTQCNAAPSSASWHEMLSAVPSIGPSPAVWPDCNKQNLFISQSNPETLKISEHFFLNTFQKTVKAQRKKSQRGLQLLSRLHLKGSEFWSPTRYSCDQFLMQQQQSPTTKGRHTWKQPRKF